MLTKRPMTTLLSDALTVSAVGGVVLTAVQVFESGYGLGSRLFFRALAANTLLSVIVVTPACLVGVLVWRWLAGRWWPNSGSSTAQSQPSSSRLTVSLLGVLVLLGVPWLVDTNWPSQPNQPNIILITMDTIRFDHVGFMGSKNPTTPYLDTLAAQGTVFENAWSTAPWTLPAMASIMTGQFPTLHGAISYDSALSSATTTIAEALAEQGYDTAGVITNQFLATKRGFADGFRLYDDSLWAASHDSLTSYPAANIAIRQLADLKEPYFLWIHTFDPHYTYLEHPDIDFVNAADGAHLGVLGHKMIKHAAKLPPKDIDYIKGVFDEEIRHMDGALETVMAAVNARSTRPQVVVAVADHGEQFMERGRIGHGKGLYEELVHVPLIVVGLDVPAGRTAAPVSTAWVYNTLVGIAAEPTGPDLRAIARGEAQSTPVAFHGSYAWGKDHRSIGATDGRYKLIWRRANKRYRLYDMAVDPGELTDLWPLISPEITALQATIDTLRQSKTPTTTVGVTDDDREQLRALGYLD